MNSIQRHAWKIGCWMAWNGWVMGNAAAQEIGIGTTAPTAWLEVKAPSAYSYPLIRVKEGNQVRLIVTADGRMGIQTADPQARLHVGGSGGSEDVVLSDVNAATGEGINLAGYAEMDFVAYGTRHSVSPTDRAVGFYRGMWLTPQWIILNNGNVGVGVASPQDRMDVDGDLRLSGGNRSIRGGADARLNIYSNINASDSRSWIELWGKDPVRNGELTLAGNYIDFRYGSIPTNYGLIGARLDSFGRMGIGTLQPQARLHIANDGMIYAEGMDSIGDTVPNGPKTAWIWNPHKAALRAGSVGADEWDWGSIGFYSVAFGRNARAVGTYSTIGGGQNNRAEGMASSVRGGGFNRASGDYSTIFGGDYNEAGPYAVVGGGIHDTASGQYSVVAGGYYNTASGDYSTVWGGRNNTASGDYSTVGGGAYNTVEAPHGWVGGRGMHLLHGGWTSFVWGYSTASNPSSVGSQYPIYSFYIGPYGHTYRVGINTPNPTYAVELPNNSTITIGRARANAWHTYSDRRLKSDIRPIDSAREMVLQWHPVAYRHHNSRWGEDGRLEVAAEGVPSYGFIAQEMVKAVPEAVYVPPDEKTDLWAVNYRMLIPILTAAIQAQEKEIQQLEHRYRQWRAEAEETEARFRRLQVKNAALQQRLRTLERQYRRRMADRLSESASSAEED